MIRTIAPQQAPVAARARLCTGSADAAYQGNTAVVMMSASSIDWFAKHLTTKRPARHLGGLPT